MAWENNGDANCKQWVGLTAGDASEMEADTGMLRVKRARCVNPAPNLGKVAWLSGEEA